MARFRLINDEHGYALSDELSTQHPLRIDFLSGQIHYRRTRGGKKELLIKAVKLKKAAMFGIVRQVWVQIVFCLLQRDAG